MNHTIQRNERSAWDDETINTITLKYDKNKMYSNKDMTSRQEYYIIDICIQHKKILPIIKITT